MLTVVGTPTDEPYFQDQWHLLANGQQVEQPNSPTFEQSLALIDINVLGAWERGYTGAGVQVAVVDGGFDLNHEDLQFVLLSEPGSLLDLIDDDNSPAFIDTSDAHGTSVAGLIGALDNDTGTVGVAYGSDLVPIRLILGAADGTGSPRSFDEREAQSILQFAGIPAPGDDGSNPGQVVDVFNRSYGPSDETRVAAALGPLTLDAYRTAATLGRGTWIDQNGDGIFQTTEIEALGAINLVAAGNGAGAGFLDPFTDNGIYDSSQYDQSTNSIYTIAVGSVDFDGSYANVATGSRGSFSETGANVLIVAPSSTAAPTIGAAQGLTAGVWTTDITGENGFNGSPVFGQELDGDFFPDINYTSDFGGTSAATPIVSGVVALMLEANPNLSYRDVQQILLQSAVQVDQFSETWVVNPYNYFEDQYEIPQYRYVEIGISGEPNDEGETEFESAIENAILPFYGDPDHVRGFFEGPFYTDMEVPFGALATVPLEALGFVGPDQMFDPTRDPVVAWPANFNPTGADGTFSLVSPSSHATKGFSRTTTNGDISEGPQGLPFDPLTNGDLLFETGSGFTVSWGYGDYLEEYGYAHGLVDAEIAVQLAEDWATYDQHLTESVTITTAIDNGSVPIRVQPLAEIEIGANTDFEVPGGISNTDINNAWYSEWTNDFGWSNITLDGGEVGSAITAGPWYNPEGDLNDLIADGSGRGDSRIQFRIDPSISEDFLSLEWIEFTTLVQSGDVDDLRLSIVSPDGTQSELSPFRREADARADALQFPQLQQGQAAPGLEVISEDIGLFTVDGFIDGSEQTLIAAIEELEDPVPAGTSWTWTTNRHWGELFSVEAQNFDNPNSDADGQWYLVLENWGNGAVELGGQFEVALHGTRATGNRIQGKIGVDDNAQGIQGSDSDEVFNFDRNVTFGEVIIDPEGTLVLDDTGTLDADPVGLNATVLLDDATDSVFYNNNYYETVDPSTGEVFRYAVVDRAEFLGLAELNRGILASPGVNDAYFDLLDGDPENMIDPIVDPPAPRPMISAAEAAFWYAEHGAGLGLTGDAEGTGDVNGDMLTDGADAAIWYAELSGRLREDLVAAETFEPLLGFGIDTMDPAATTVHGLTDTVGEAFTYQNFDYSQETFASGIVVQATQFRVDYDAAGNITGRTATGVVDHFTTGGDGNYWFDVEATPEPPSFADDPIAYAEWLNDFGMTFEYEVSIVGDSDVQDRIIDRSYAAVADMPGFSGGVSRGGGSIDYQTGELKYNVPIFASPSLDDGQTTVLRDVNFLLTVDPAETNVDVSGTVYRDRNGDGVQQTSFEESIVGATVFFDANGNGVNDGEPSAVTDENGDYSFTISGLNTVQAVQIRVDAATVPANLEFVDPVGGVQSISITPGSPSTGVDFTLNLFGGEPAQVTGTVFDDTNGNGVQEAGEEGVDTSNQVRAYIDLNGNGVFDAATEPSAFTQADGSFVIETDETGTFDVRLDQAAFASPQIVQTAPADNGGFSVTLADGQTASGAVFGVFDGRNQDFGDLFVDATGNFPTLLANNGARHVVVNGVYLGSGVDVDTDGFQNPVRNPDVDGTGDDTNGSDDEDGVTLVTTDVQANSTIEFDIVANGAGAVLNAWFDFNADGDWDDPGEQIFVDTQDLATGSTVRIVAPTPADVDESSDAVYAARFRWGPFGIGYSGSANTGEVEDYLYAATDPVAVSGAARIDSDGDSEFDTNDTALVGATVFFDRNLNGVLDDDEPRDVTDANGSYQILLNTTTEIVVTLRVDESTIDPALQSLIPIDGIFSQTVSPSSPVVANFLYGFEQGINGTVFDDDNGNGSNDTGETGLAGIVVEVLDATDTVIASVTSDANGSYSVPIPQVGSYTVRTNLDSMPFFVQTTADQSVVVSVGAVSEAPDLGVENTALDFTEDYGDLIVNGVVNFPTTLADDGARHTVTPGFFLGDVAPDADPGDRESVNATADDNLFDDDEDGVSVVTAEITASSVLEIDVKATGTGGLLNAWIDFNNDGDWDDVGEQIAVDRALTSGVISRLVVNTPADVDATADSYAARFRWSTQAGLGVTGLASDGEVEDYLLPRVSGVTPTESPADFNGDGSVDLLDLDILGLNFLTGPGATKAQGDANGDGNVDLLDLDILGSEFPVEGLALATAPAEDPGYEVVDLTGLPFSAPVSSIPMPVLHPIEENEPETPALFSAAVDTGSTPIDVSPASGTVVTPSDSGEDAIDAALLEWSLDAPADEADERSAYRPASREAAEDDEIEEDEALALAFAL